MGLPDHGLQGLWGKEQFQGLCELKTDIYYDSYEGEFLAFLCEECIKKTLCKNLYKITVPNLLGIIQCDAYCCSNSAQYKVVLYEMSDLEFLRKLEKV